MDQAAISWAMSQGAPVTCATCRHFHEGNMHCGQTECGGPSAGRDFPNYDGPIPRRRFVERCLICGSGEIAFLIVLSEGKTKFSLCKRHKKVFEYVGAAEGKINRPVKLVALP